MKRFDGNPISDPHFNKFSRENIPIPHMHDPYCPGGIRRAETFEIPK